MRDTSKADPRPVGTMWLLDLGQHREDRVSIVPRIPVSFQRVGPEAVALLSVAMGFEEPTPVLERFAGARRCYVGWVDGALANYGWVSFGEEWISELNLHIQLAPDEAYIWDCATLPEYRRQGLYPTLLAHIVGELRAEGLGRVWIGADYGSVDSQKGIIRAGFQPIADFYTTPAAATAPAAERFYVIGRPGIGENLVQDAHDALLSG